MELDAKLKVLLAIYTEYQKDLPDMGSSIKADKLKMDRKIYMVAIDKLQNEGLIHGAQVKTGGNSHLPVMVFTDNVKMTRYGIDFVEQKLEIDKSLSGKEKVMAISESAAKWGWGQIKDIAVKVLSEITSKTMGI